MPKKKIYSYEGQKYTSWDLSKIAGCHQTTMNDRLLRYKGNISFALNPPPVKHKEHYMSKIPASHYECRMLQESFMGDPETADNVYV